MNFNSTLYVSIDLVQISSFFSLQLSQDSIKDIINSMTHSMKQAELPISFNSEITMSQFALCSIS